MKKYLIHYIEYKHTGAVGHYGPIILEKERKEIFRAKNDENAIRRAEEKTCNGKLFRLEEIELWKEE